VRLLYLIDSLAPGGAERSLAALAPAYRARGVDLEVASLRDRRGVQGELETAGARLWSLTGGGGRVGAIRRARALIRERRPDLVHTTLFEADVAGRIGARLAGVPVVSSLVNEEYGPEHLGNPRLRQWKVRGVQVVDAATARLTVRLHAVSVPVADVMARRLRYPRARIDVVPRGRDPAALGDRTESRRRQARTALDLADDDRVVLAVCRQDHQKGLDVLVESIARLRGGGARVQLLVAGREGDQSTRLASRVTQLGLGASVRFLGERDDVADLLCAADVFALPSRREGLAGALLEAMALDAPVVASDIPATREVVDESSAGLVPPDDAGALADAIEAVFAHPEQAKRRSAVARVRFLDRFTVDRAADGMVAFYERVLAGRSVVGLRTAPRRPG